jgi:hypothetical protein
LRSFLPIPLLLALLLSAPAQAQQPDAVVAPLLKQAYAGDLAGAATRLHALASTSDPQPLVLWNLAAVRARMDQLGRALHATLRLLEHNPPDDLKRRAIELRDRLQAELVERARKQGSPATLALRSPRSPTERWVLSHDAQTWRWLFYASFWLAVLAMMLRALLASGRRRVGATAIAALCFLGACITGTSDLLARNMVEPTRLAVVLVERSHLRESLVDGAPTHALPEGLVVQVQDRVTEQTLFVRLADGREGYVGSATVGVVD